MKQYKYNLFPKPLLVAAYLLITLAFAYIIYNISSGDQLNIAGPVVCIIISLVIVSFRSGISFDDSLTFVIKESSLAGMTLLREKIKIPFACNHIIIRKEAKKGTGHYRFILPVTYSFESFDIFLCSGSERVRLINTDHSRALKIAEFLKLSTGIRYTFENIK